MVSPRYGERFTRLVSRTEEKDLALPETLAEKLPVTSIAGTSSGGLGRRLYFFGTGMLDLDYELLAVRKSPAKDRKSRDNFRNGSAKASDLRGLVSGRRVVRR